MNRIPPTCRYNHGDLVVVPDDAGEPKQYCASEFPIKSLLAHNVYIFRIYKCLKCSYLELHDVPHDEIKDG